MEIISFDTLYIDKPLKNRDAILTIGVFDGFHLGHRALLERMLSLHEKYRDSLLVLITFSVNPKTNKPKNVDTLRLREEIVEKLGIDYFVIIDFSPEFSKISACGFIRMISSSLNPVAVVVGEDFRFGYPEKSAKAEDLASLFLEEGKKPKVVIEKSILTEGGEKISSTLVRRVIENGEVECISALTGRNYRVDLMPIPYRVDSKVLVILRSSIQQLLPPPGVYWARLAYSNAESTDVVVSVLSDSVVLKSRDGVKLDKEGVQLDSIFFLEKENGIK